MKSRPSDLCAALTLVGVAVSGCGGDAAQDAGVDATEVGVLDAAAERDAPEETPIDAGPPDAWRPPWDSGPPPAPHPPEHCAYFLTGEVDLVGEDADGDGTPNGWDHCPNNAAESLDSDRDGIGSHADDDDDGDGILDTDDPDHDGDGASDADETAAGTDVGDPSSLPGLPRLETGLGVFSPFPGWYRGDLHVHTAPSHDSDEPLASYFAPAVAAGLTFLWITDHRVFETPFDPAWSQDRVLLIPGMEWGGGGHANMGGIRTDNTADYDDPADVRRAWRLARLQGAVQSLNHYGADAEYWDRTFAAAPDLVDALDVMEVWNIWWPLNAATNDVSIARWEAWLNEGRRIGAVGGSDAHTATGTLGFPTTVVYARSLSMLGILDGIRRGRTYVTQSHPATGRRTMLLYEARPELDFRARSSAAPSLDAMLGDEVPPGPVELHVAVRHAHGPVVVIRGGVEIARFDAHEPGADVTETVMDDAPAGSWYRVQMREGDAESSAMLLFSSPIYVGRGP